MLVWWLSKKQPTIETYIFRANFVAIKTGMEKLRGLRYKLRMMGILSLGPWLIYGDNMLVICNIQRPEPTLRKKRNLICCHEIRESVKMVESMTAWVPSGENTADFLTKVLYRSKRRHIVENVMRNIYNEH